MIRKEYNIYRSEAASFDEALSELLAAMVGAEREIVRIVLFGAPKDNVEYGEQRTLFEQRCRTHFGEYVPMLSYVAQAPLRYSLAAEVTTISREDAKHIVRHGDYITLGDEILSAGIYAPLEKNVAQQAEQIFARVAEILSAEGVSISDIVRQWNYIERITHMADEGQHYQLFNDARSHFYQGCQWHNGYPAATGIGTQAGGVTVLFDAVKSSASHSKAVDNPLQVSAHAYSQQVLINNTEAHKTTPKFERARYMCGEDASVYISGTAAIRGEESCSEDAVGQTRLTMENIDYLISEENLVKSGVAEPEKMAYASLRAYLKYREDLEQVVEWMDGNYPAVDVLYLWADICREELLIEIEGIAKQVN